MTSSADTATTRSQSELAEQILTIVRDVLAEPGLGVDDEVMDHGGTSLSIVRILTQVGSGLGVTVNPRDLGGVVTARNLARAAR